MEGNSKAEPTASGWRRRHCQKRTSSMLSSMVRIRRRAGVERKGGKPVLIYFEVVDLKKDEGAPLALVRTVSKQKAALSLTVPLKTASQLQFVGTVSQMH